MAARGEGSSDIYIITDWHIDYTDRLRIGICEVTVSPPPYNEMSLKKGFPLPNPTHRRCALFAFVLGLEIADTLSRWEHDDGEIRSVFICTKSKWLMTCLEQSKRWVATGKWPKESGCYRNLLMRALDIMKNLPAGSYQYTLIEREEGEQTEVRIDEFDDSERAKEKMDEQFKNAGEEGKEKVISMAVRERKLREIDYKQALDTGGRVSRNKKK